MYYKTYKVKEKESHWYYIRFHTTTRVKLEIVKIFQFSDKQ